MDEYDQEQLALIQTLMPCPFCGQVPGLGYGTAASCNDRLIYCDEDEGGCGATISEEGWPKSDEATFDLLRTKWNRREVQP